MITIGELAKRGNVTVKTLRHYAHLGLLKPVWIDRFSGYRYYNESQLMQLQRIQVLKDMGFTLRQLAPLLNEHISVDVLRSILAQKREELSCHIQVEQARLSTVEARLNDLELGYDVLYPKKLIHKENHSMEPKIVNLPTFEVIGIRYTGMNQNNEIPKMWDQEIIPRCSEIQPKINAEIMYGVCDLTKNSDEFEYIGGSQVPSGTQIPAGMVRKTIPANKYAVFYHLGNVSEISQTMEQIFSQWLAAFGLERASGPDFEFYNEEFDPSAGEQCKTYIYIPIK